MSPAKTQQKPKPNDAGLVRLYPDAHHYIEGEAVAIRDVTPDEADRLLAYGRKGAKPDGEPFAPAYHLELQAPAWEHQADPANTNFLNVASEAAEQGPAEAEPATSEA